MLKIRYLEFNSFGSARRSSAQGHACLRTRSFAIAKSYGTLGLQRAIGGIDRLYRRVDNDVDLFSGNDQGGA